MDFLGINELTCSILSSQLASAFQSESMSRIGTTVTTLNQLILLKLCRNSTNCSQNTRLSTCSYQERAMVAFTFHTLHGKFISGILKLTCRIKFTRVTINGPSWKKFLLRDSWLATESPTGSMIQILHCHKHLEAST